MWVDENNFSFNELIKQALMHHVSINANWYGNPKDSSFGIFVSLCWDGNVFGSTVINFFDENSNKNL